MISDGLRLSVILAFFALAVEVSAGQVQPVEVNLCAVVASPAEYDEKDIQIEGVLSPSEHYLLLYSPACEPDEDHDVTVKAVFPEQWKPDKNGKRLRKLFRRGKEVRVKLIGTFENKGNEYGLDGTKFRFVIKSVVAIVRRSSSDD